MGLLSIPYSSTCEPGGHGGVKRAGSILTGTGHGITSSVVWVCMEWVRVNCG